MFDKGFHTLVMALNFRHADFHFVPARALSVLPTQKQLNTLCYLRQLLHVFGSSPELISVPACGRRFVSMMSSLADLSAF